MGRLRIQPARDPDEIAEVRALFLEYAESLNFSLCFQGFDDEIAALPGRYAPPAGELLLAIIDRAYAGAIGARPLEDGICEMKRLYVRPDFRGHGVGRVLTESIVDWARCQGYRAMRLDTMNSMHTAQALYKDFGFRPIDAYGDNQADGLSYYELALETFEPAN